MGFILPQPIRQEAASYIFYDKLFTEEECDKIIALHKTREKREPFIGGGENGQLDPKKRISDLYWVEWNKEETDWIYQRMSGPIVQGNHKWFGFHLSHMGESLQLTKYTGKAKGHYEWHEDHGFTQQFACRKLSGIVVLSDKFKGGKFEFLHTGEVKELTKGTLLLFPSFQTHRVTPTTRGTRWSLVFWVTGPTWV